MSEVWCENWVGLAAEPDPVSSATFELLLELAGQMITARRHPR